MEAKLLMMFYTLLRVFQENKKVLRFKKEEESLKDFLFVIFNLLTVFRRLEKAEVYQSDY